MDLVRWGSLDELKLLRCTTSSMAQAIHHVARLMPTSESTIPSQGMAAVVKDAGPGFHVEAVLSVGQFQVQVQGRVRVPPNTHPPRDITHPVTETLSVVKC